MTFGELKAKLKFRLGNRTDIDELIANNINRAYLDIATRERFVAGGKIITLPQRIYFPTLLSSDSFLTEKDTQSYDIAPDVLWVIGIKNLTKNIPITLKTFRDFYKFIGAPFRGTPVMAYVQGTKLWFYPTPDEEYSIEYWYKKKVQPLFNNTDVPELPEEWHEAIFLLAAAMCYFDLLEDGRGMNHMMLLENFIIEHLGQEMAYFANVYSKST
jgi:hypothetical protein